MKIYFSHSRSFDYVNELYKPLLDSNLSKEHQLILPFMNGGGQSQDTKVVLQAVNLVVAEVSFSHTSQGIELGWADMLGKPIVCFYREGYHPSSSISMITHHLYAYKNPLDLIRQLETMFLTASARAQTATDILRPQVVMKGIN